MSGTMQKVQIAQDDSGHFYVLPNDLLQEFLNEQEDESFVDSGGFGDKYGKYMTGGSLNLIQLYALI